jgi:hypothetical protein
LFAQAYVVRLPFGSMTPVTLRKKLYRSVVTFPAGSEIFVDPQSMYW